MAEQHDRSPAATLVIGGAGDIGMKVVERLLDDGHRIAVIDSNADRCHALQESLRQAHQDAWVCAGDAADATLVGGVLEQMEAAGAPVTGLVHCAGTYAEPRVFRAMPVAEWERVLHSSLTSAFVSAQQAVRWMYPRARGRIVFLSSVVALHLGTALEDVAYTTAKAGLLGLTRSLARALGRRNITVNVLAPGLLRTQMTEGLFEATGGMLEAGWRQMCPLQRLAKGEEVAAVAAFLLSAEASFINGAVIPVDGGYQC